MNRQTTTSVNRKALAALKALSLVLFALGGSKAYAQTVPTGTEVFRNSNLVMGYVSPGQTANVSGYNSCFASMGNYIWLRSDNSANIEPVFEAVASGGTVRINKNAHITGTAAYVCQKSGIHNTDVRAGYVKSGTNIGKDLTCVTTIANFLKLRQSSGTVPGSVACNYNKTTGVITGTATQAGSITDCGYVCVAPTSTRVTTTVSKPFPKIFSGTENIGTGLSCTRGTNYFATKCSGAGTLAASYVPGTGIALKGDTHGCGANAFSYYCVDPSKRACADGVDNDNDGVKDAQDPGCWTDINNPATYNPALEDEGRATTQCQDRSDNDRDGVIDAADPGCWTDKTNPATYDKTRHNEAAATTQCQDGVDNDSDEVTDAADPGCWRDPSDPATFDKTRNNEGAATTQCQDGVDNDSDNVVDAADPGCWSNPSDPATFDKTRNNEGAATTQCQDGVDNDSDGVKDAADPGCWSNPSDPTTFDKTRNNEGAAATQCQDGSDNDGDGVVDAQDPGCWADKRNPASYDKTRNNEGAATTECQDAVDNDGDDLTDAKDPGCWSDPSNPASFDKTRNNEGAATSQCQDGSDNDGDTLVDAKDPGCWSDPSNSSTFDKTRNNEGAATSGCQDKQDNDGDGLVDLADPGCKDASDSDETDEVSKLQVTTECVFDNKDGSFTAYFGYENLLGSQVEVVTDAAKKTVNSFSPAPEARGQVTTFKVGRQKGVFSVPFNGDDLTWTVQIVGGGKSTATASKTSKACLPVEPVAECIDGATDGFKGTFGYINPNDFEVKLSVGAQNKFSPTPEDRGQPTAFFTGTNKAAFSANFKDQLTWTIAGKSASVTPTTPVCPGGCLGTSTTEIKGNLDEVALKLASLAKRAADTIAKQGSKSVTGSATSKAKTDAARSKKKADAFAKRANELLIQFPAIVKSCPNAAATCQTIDRGPVIEEIKQLYAKLRNMVKRASARSDFRKSGATSRLNAMVEEAKTTEQAGLTAITQLPRFSTECK